MDNEKEIRYFSMFTGVGGFELGLERANALPITERDESRGNEEDCRSNKQIPLATQQFTCVGCSEIDKYASELLKKRFPSVKNWGDCTKINPSELPEFDMLCGGFPCQAFSIAGKRRGFQDTRGTLFFEIARILKVKRPKLILLENVKGLLNHEKGKTFSVIIQTLEELGYRTQWVVLNSKFFGVPQNRERVFIIGSLRGESRQEILPFKKSHVKNEITIKRIGHMEGFRRYNQTYDESGIVEAIDVSGGGGHQPCIPMRWSRTEKGKQSRKEAMKQGKDLTPFSDGNRELVESKDDASGCVTGALNKDALLKQKMKIRRLTPIECERLQGFPDGWTEGFSDTQRYKMMGNAVTVNVIAAIGERL